MAITIALAFSILTSWASYYNSDKIILAVTKARPATEAEEPTIRNSNLLPVKAKGEVLFLSEASLLRVGKTATSSRS